MARSLHTSVYVILIIIHKASKLESVPDPAKAGPAGAAPPPLHVYIYSGHTVSVMQLAMIFIQDVGYRGHAAIIFT